MSETLFDFDYEPDEAAPAPAAQAGKKAKAAHVWERDEHDWYVEPERVTDALLTVEKFPGITLDPCCGGGNIVRAFRRAGYSIHGRDLIERKGQEQPWFLGTADFLNSPPEAGGHHNVVSNPPFYSGEGTEKFIRNALRVACNKVAVFTDVRFLFGLERQETLYTDHRPTRVYFPSPRVSCPPGAVIEAGHKPEAGTASFVWMVWDTTHPAAATTMHWLRVASPARRRKAAGA